MLTIFDLGHKCNTSLQIIIQSPIGYKSFYSLPWNVQIFIILYFVGLVVFIVWSVIFVIRNE